MEIKNRWFRALCKGNDFALEELYLRYQQRLLHYLVRFLVNIDIARDILQDVFIKVIECADTFDPKYKFSTWVFTIASNMAKNELRKLNRTTISHSILENTSDTAPEIESQIDQNLFNKELDRVLRTMSEEHQNVFILRYQQQLSLKEIAQIEDCPSGTVKSRLHYALKQLAGQLTSFNRH